MMKLNMCGRFMGFMLCLVVLALSCTHVGSQRLFHRGAVVCADEIAAGIGLRVLEDGGNAVDAACATALALAVTYPQAGNIGGGGFALIYSSDSGRAFFIDFRETAPAAATAAHYLDSAGQYDPRKALSGPSSAGTPGTVAGLYEMHRRFGSRPWPDLVRPSRFLADTGFVVGRPLAASVAENADELGRFEATRSVFFPDGSPLAPGKRLIQTDLAVTLGLIEQKGKDGFYRGETADAIAAYCAANGGMITRDDLQGYMPVWRNPVHIKFGSLDILTAGLPSSGGVVIGQILKMLDRFDIERYAPDDPNYIHLFTEACRRAYADRSEYLGDPAFTEDFTARLIDDEYIAARVRSIDPDRASRSQDIRPGLADDTPQADQTTHLVVADGRGNIVSLTYTVNAWFGSKAVVPGAGFLLNNEMDDFSIVPNAPNQFGLIENQANGIAAGKRMLSSMSPTIILESGRPIMALGSPGGSKIITAVAQTIINYHVFDLPLDQAVSRPRFHHQWLPDTLYLEQNGYSAETIRTLTAMGHVVAQRAPFCEVMALAFSHEGLYITGAADPRRAGGCVAGY